MRVIEQGYLERYFTRIGNSYLVNDDVKSLVDFSHLNLQADDFPTPDGEFRGIDVVFCRNVMIYFPLATTRKVVEKIAATLQPGGCLFLGHAETLSQISSRFERHAHAGSFYYRERKDRPLPQSREPSASPLPAGELNVVRPQPSPPPLPADRGRLSGRTPARAEPDPEELYKKAETLFEAEAFPKASETLAKLLTIRPDHSGALVLQGFIMANDGRFEEALTLCARALEIDDLLPEAYFLRGLLLDMNDRLAAAVEEYRKTNLLRMEFVMSHYHLGRLYYRLGKETEGARELRNTLKLLERARQGSIIPFSGGLSREVFLQQIRGELAEVA
jgi:chemotaxis protein methyltransferase CheR